MRSAPKSSRIRPPAQVPSALVVRLPLQSGGAARRHERRSCDQRLARSSRGRAAPLARLQPNPRSACTPTAPRRIPNGAMRSVPVCLLLTLLNASCAGSAASSTAKAPSAGSGSTNDSQASSEALEAEGESPATSQSPKSPSCDDGTCSACGSGMCPVGWYCDEGASGGAACSWLKECAEKPTCGCVIRVLGSTCQCREEAGGLKVSCK